MVSKNPEAKSIIIVHGSPGAGKSTHASKFAEAEPQTAHLSIGNHLRTIQNGSTHSQFTDAVKAQSSQLSASKPLSHEVVNSIVFEFISKNQASLFLIDGYPRFIEQLSIFYDSLQEENISLAGIISLVISKKLAIQRLVSRGQRIGESAITPEFVEWRLNEYQTRTLPTILTMSEDFPLKTINAEKDLEMVWEDFALSVQTLTKK